MLLVSTRITLALSSPYFLRISFQIPNSLFRSDFSLYLLIMDALDSVFEPLIEFSKDSYRLVKRCHKPDRKGTHYSITVLMDSFKFQILISRVRFQCDFSFFTEFSKVAVRTAIGFVVMGFVGFFVNLHRGTATQGFFVVMGFTPPRCWLLSNISICLESFTEI